MTYADQSGYADSRCHHARHYITAGSCVAGFVAIGRLLRLGAWTSAATNNILTASPPGAGQTV